MSTRNNNNSKSSNVSSKSSTDRKTAASPQPQQTSTSRQASRSQTMAQPTTQPSPSTQASSTTRRARKPVTIRVRTTGEEIRRVPVERSGYRVVRYEGRYHTVRGGGRTAPYIVGAEDGEDTLGRA